jgi:hypothetical protein
MSLEVFTGHTNSIFLLKKKEEEEKKRKRKNSIFIYFSCIYYRIIFRGVKALFAIFFMALGQC